MKPYIKYSWLVQPYKKNFKVYFLKALAIISPFLGKVLLLQDLLLDLLVFLITGLVFNIVIGLCFMHFRYYVIVKHLRAPENELNNC